MTSNHMKTRTQNNSPLKTLCLLAATGQMHLLPVLGRSAEAHLRQQLRRNKTRNGFLNYGKVKSPPVLSMVKDYLTEQYAEQEPLMKGSFTYIVDTGC